MDGGAGQGAGDDRSAEPGEGAHCGGVWLAELASVGDGTLLELANAEALGLTDHTVRPPRQVLAEHLAERRLLLVLDGFEQLVDNIYGEQLVGSVRSV
ncbi:hypothetical protein DRB89_38645 [Streptomyces sp. ICC4]|nr:hypothetical protein DRB89_38645 [Streptomyces sp. ICC4]